ncbi:hypothetical protein GCM10023224_19140 [Streptomonospora halophila]|uniref:Lipoprotein n=1 Tax=Streptomonospora halophila TaxID=427369 RepID=A0ABP9GDL7_9ACTN
MRGAERAVAAAAVVAMTAGVVAGCGGDGGGADTPASGPPTADAGGSTAPSPEQASEGGMNGVWESADDSGIRTLTVVGEMVRTEGDPACPGTLTPAQSGSTARIELDCEPPDPGHEAGTAALNAEDDHLIVTWDDADGMPQAFTRTEEKPVIEE